MKSTLYKFFLVVIIFCLSSKILALENSRGLEKFRENVQIDASSNARTHSNLGNIYFDEKNYTLALSEYEIALKLSDDSAISSTYLYNIARCLYYMDYYKDSKKAVLEAINRNFMNITYYELLVDCFIKLKTINKELEHYKKDKINPYSKVVVGLIYLKTNRKVNAKIVFDEFVCLYPDFEITSDIRLILRKL